MAETQQDAGDLQHAPQKQEVLRAESSSSIIGAEPQAFGFLDYNSYENAYCVLSDSGTPARNHHAGLCRGSHQHKHREPEVLTGRRSSWHHNQLSQALEMHTHER